MKLTIKSRKLKKDLTFSRPGKGYIFVDINGYAGTLGRQICDGGMLMGSTIAYHGESYKELDAICRSWYRAYLRRINKFE